MEEKSIKKICSKHPAGTSCTIECREGFRFVDAKLPNQLKYTCSLDGRWNPTNTPPTCVPICMFQIFLKILFKNLAREPARYELNVGIHYVADTPVAPECLKVS